MDALALPCAAQRTVRVLENRPIARDTYLMRLDDPEMAAAIRPGQFLMVRPASGYDPLLGRPFAVYDVTRDDGGTPVAVEIVYLVLGAGTSALARQRAGDRVSVWGPLGNGFGPPPGGDVVFVAGGIGQTPFLALGRWWMGSAAYGGDSFAAESVCNSATLLYGARDAAFLAGLDDFRSAGLNVAIATDNGSAGHHGYVTDLLNALLKKGQRPSRVVGCGPVPMLKALTAIVTREGIPSDLSLENHMACGFGACFSCVTPIRQDDGSADLRRVCVEGPIFDAKDVIFA